MDWAKAPWTVCCSAEFLHPAGLWFCLMTPICVWCFLRLFWVLCKTPHCFTRREPSGTNLSSAGGIFWQSVFSIEKGQNLLLNQEPPGEAAKTPLSLSLCYQSFEGFRSACQVVNAWHRLPENLWDWLKVSPREFLYHSWSVLWSQLGFHIITSSQAAKIPRQYPSFPCVCWQLFLVPALVLPSTLWSLESQTQKSMKNNCCVGIPCFSVLGRDSSHTYVQCCHLSPYLKGWSMSFSNWISFAFLTSQKSREK